MVSGRCHQEEAHCLREHRLFKHNGIVWAILIVLNTSPLSITQSIVTSTMRLSLIRCTIGIHINNAIDSNNGIDSPAKYLFVRSHHHEVRTTLDAHFLLPSIRCCIYFTSTFYPRRRTIIFQFLSTFFAPPAFESLQSAEPVYILRHQ